LVVQVEVIKVSKTMQKCLGSNPTMLTNFLLGQKQILFSDISLCLCYGLCLQLVKPVYSKFNRQLMFKDRDLNYNS